MISLGQGFGSREGYTMRQYPEAKGYIWTIVNVESTTSKKGRAMVVFDMDICEGPLTGSCSEYPKKMFQLIDDEDGLNRLKSVFDSIIDENKAMFPGDVYGSGDFDEKRLIGCTVGAVLKWDATGKYTNLSYICSKEKALAAPTADKPVASTAVVKDRNDNDAADGLF